MLKYSRLLFLLLWISISLWFYGVTPLFLKLNSNLAHEKQNSPIPASELYFPLPRRNTLGLTWHSYSLVESELCSWVDSPIKYSYLASVCSPSWVCAWIQAPPVYFRLGEMFQCFLVAEVKKGCSILCPVVLACITEGGKTAFPGLAGFVTWALLTPEHLPGNRTRSLCDIVHLLPGGGKQTKGGYRSNENLSEEVEWI